MNPHAESTDTRILTKNHAAATIAAMNARNRSERESLLTEGLVAKINAARAAAGYASSRELARELGWSSQYISDRLDGGNPRTGRRKALTALDLAQLAQALDLDPVELMKMLIESVTAVDDELLNGLAGD